METCLEWLTHVRGYIVSIAIHAGMPAVAIRHGFAALQDFKKVPNVKMVGSLFTIRIECAMVSIFANTAGVRQT